MVRIYASGLGPLPWEKPQYIHGACCRTWHFLRPILEAGHEVCLVASRVINWSSNQETPLVQKTEMDNLTYYLVDELKKFNDPSFHQTLIDKFKPEALLGITSTGCRPFAQVHCDAPMWADIDGYVMGEAQLLCEERGDNRYVYDFWKRYDGAMQRADLFSATSGPQRLALIGELGALGRLNRHNAEYEFVHTVPNARPQEELESAEVFLRNKTVPKDAFVLLWLGGYNHWCDPRTLFCALEIALSKNDSIHFVSTGGKIDGHCDSTFPDFQSMISQSKFQDRYHFTGWIDSDTIPSLLQELDAGINVDRQCYESVFGARHRITEMLRAALPVITTSITEISMEAVQAEAALGSPVGDAQALAENILFAAQHRGKVLEMGVAGRELFLERYTDEITVRPLLEWLQAPTHAPDWGKDDVPWRENLLYEKLQSRPLMLKVKDFLRNELNKRRR